jgi:hypothetical protein
MTQLFPGKIIAWHQDSQARKQASTDEQLDDASAVDTNVIHANVIHANVIHSSELVAEDDDDDD